MPRLGRREGGRETPRGEGEGGRWRNRLCRLYRRGRFSVTREIPPTLPARPAEGRLNLAPPRGILAIRQRPSQSPCRTDPTPASSPRWEGRASRSPSPRPYWRGASLTQPRLLETDCRSPPPGCNVIGGRKAPRHTSLESPAHPSPRPPQPQA